MSIAINPRSAASSLDDAAAPSAVTLDASSFLPFASILDEQASANEDAGDVGEADAPRDVFDAVVRASQPPIDSLAALLAVSIPAARALLRQDEIDQSTTTQGPINKDKRPIDATALFVQTVRNAVTPPDRSPAPSASAPSMSTSGVQEADDVGEAAAPFDAFDPAVAESQPAVHSLAALLTVSIPDARPLLRQDEIDQFKTTQGSIEKDKPAVVDPAVLLLLEAQNAVRQLDTSPGRSASAPSTSGVKNAVSIPGPRALLRQDESDQSTTTQVSINKDKRSVEPTTVLVQAVQNAVTPLDMSPAPTTSAPSPSGVKETDDVGEAADALRDVFDAAIPASQPPIASLTALPTASLPSARPLLRQDEIDRSTTTQGSIEKDRPAIVDLSGLLLPAAQNAVTLLDTSPAPSAPTPSMSDVKNPITTDEPIRRANNDELVPHLFTALTETDARAVLNADSDDAPLPAAATPLTDVLIKTSEQNPQAEPLRVPDLPLPRTPTTTAPAAGPMVDAIRLAINQGPPFDQDRGSAQSSTAGFERRGPRAAVVPVIHVTEAVSVGAAVRPPAPSSVSTVTLPNEDDVMSSIVQSMRLQMRDGVGTAVVHLEPDYLGAVSISLRVENGVVTASLHAENPQVRAWMEANAPLLRESLAGQGLSLDRLLVTEEHVVDDPSQGRRQRQEQEQQTQQRPRRSGAATFEVVV